MRGNDWSIKRSNWITRNKRLIVWLQRDVQCSRTSYYHSSNKQCCFCYQDFSPWRKTELIEGYQRCNNLITVHQHGTLSILFTEVVLFNQIFLFNLHCLHLSRILDEYECTLSTSTKTVKGFSVHLVFFKVKEYKCDRLCDDCLQVYL